MKKTIYTTLAIILAISSCKKEDDKTNNSNSTSTNKKQQISMLVNGVSYSVTTGEVADDKIYAHIANDRNRFNLNAEKGDKDFKITQINAKLDTLNTIQNNGITFSQWEDGGKIYTTIGNTKGKMNYLITKKNEYVTGFHLVEGTFYGTLYNSQKTDSVVITNGQIKILD